jgi:hypothetical protein
MDGHNQLFFNEYFLQHSFINQVKLSKNVRIWRDFYNPYCTYSCWQLRYEQVWNLWAGTG